MDVRSFFIHFETQGHTDIIDITPALNEKLQESGLREGQMTVFGIGSTTGITTLEFEPGLVNHDVAEMLKELAPYGKDYSHNQTWGDDNGAAHLRSAIVGTHITIPVVDRALILGTWQQVVFIDFDTRPRKRRVVVQCVGK